jgi:hypothetical protein
MKVLQRGMVLYAYKVSESSVQMICMMTSDYKLAHIWAVRMAKLNLTLPNK